MIKVNDNTVMVGATEFRSDMPKFMKMIHVNKVIVMKRGEPVAVFQNFKDYQEEEDWRDEFEDLVLGHIAKERDDASKDEDFISHDELVKELGLSE